MLPWWALVVFDLLLTGFVLCVFAFFHHALTHMRVEEYSGAASSTQTDIAYGYGGEKSGGSRPEDWQDKFKDRFSDEKIITENSYKSPDISIDLTKYSSENSSPALTYYVADIYIAQIENFQTCFAPNGNAGPPEEIARSSYAVLAMNGDYCIDQTSGLLVRNGELYLTEQTTCDICVLYRDGSMATYGANEYAVDDILKKDPYQVWKFGPELLDDKGSAKKEFNTSDALLNSHPRSGIGYFEPGHYCFVVVDGRQKGYSDGLSMSGFAELFAELGCKCAYNLDGGASAAMVFNGKTANSPCGGGRYIGDMLIIRETGEPKG